MRTALLASMLVLVAPGAALAHDDSPGVLSLVERDDGRFDVVFSPPNDTRASGTSEVSPRFPAQCTVDDRVLTCAGGLSGAIEIAGLRGTRMVTVITVTRLGAEPEEHVVTG